MGHIFFTRANLIKICTNMDIDNHNFTKMLTSLYNNVGTNANRDPYTSICSTCSLYRYSTTNSRLLPKNSQLPLLHAIKMK